MTGFSAETLTLPTVALATLLPFAAFVVILLFTRSRPRLSAAVAVGVSSVSLAGTLVLLTLHWNMEKPVQHTARWLVSGTIEIGMGYLLDPVSLLMLAVVAAVSFLIQVYSLGYMAGDPGFSRYFAFMSLFVWAMFNLVVSPTMFQLYIFWELVGLSSYLLIGFWYEKLMASQAGKKAFVMTRLGDAAMFLGILLVLLHLGNLDILEMDSPKAAASMSPELLTLSALLIFGGIVGKSAQFPLLTWLPDAMQGPTPVSALLHSSTMVAAGIYLYERLYPFFLFSRTAMTVGLAVGTVSMLLASTMAMVNRDIKQIWAYSTISQLGFMLMGLDAGSLFSGAFHLTTHAAFKALLFLCSGVFIHRYATNDIFELGRQGCRSLKIPMACLIIAAGALSGLPLLSGFFSKEVILGSLAELSNPLWLGAGLLGVFLTSYYAFRLVFILLFPGESGPGHGEAPEASAPSHGSAHSRFHEWILDGPLIVLAGVTLLLGLFQVPLEQFLRGGEISGLHWPDPLHHPVLPYVSVALAALGLGLSWVEFGRRGAPRVGFVERLPGLFRLFSQRWYLDHVYGFLVDRGIDRGISRLLYLNDHKVIDGFVDGTAESTAAGGRITAFLHTGMIQYRLLTTFAVVVFLALYFFL